MTHHQHQQQQMVMVWCYNMYVTVANMDFGILVGVHCAVVY